MIRSSSAPFFPFLSFFSTSRSSGHKSGANSSKERKIDIAVKSVRERERESLSRNELRTIFISHDWLVSIRPSTGPGCFPLRSTLPRIRLAVVFHPRGKGREIIRLEPRPTENSHSSLFLRVFFRHALLLSFPPTYGYNVRRVNWTRSHRDCVFVISNHLVL